MFSDFSVLKASKIILKIYIVIPHLGQADFLEVTDTPISFYCNQVCFLSMCLTFKEQIFSGIVCQYRLLNEGVAIWDPNKYTVK